MYGIFFLNGLNVFAGQQAVFFFKQFITYESSRMLYVQII